MGAMKWFMMGVEELVDPDKSLEENIKTNIGNKVEVRGEKFGVSSNDIEYAYNSMKAEGEYND
tara:strand:+ start:388 stop:576 length:189 start_codon:yes stop_codon:yes gene_type:complete